RTGRQLREQVGREVGTGGDRTVEGIGLKAFETTQESKASRREKVDAGDRAGTFRDMSVNV
ncbi:hypothetical protein, partial [Salmonella enterica]|uniref:hypothetical protein n=1 Tax=Salmonella enterica TaxID=28901 RepID=UPI00398C7663